MSSSNFLRNLLFCNAVALVGLLVSDLRAQDAGFGTFNDAVSQTIEAPSGTPTPPPAVVVPVPRGARQLNLTPGEELTFNANGDRIVTQPTPTPAPPERQFIPGLEYDYRFSQQKTGDQFSTDVNELHFPVTFVEGTAQISLEYFHFWTDAEGNGGLTRSSDGDGMKLTVTKTLISIPATGKKPTWDILVSLPFYFKSEDLDALTANGRRESTTHTYQLTPFSVIKASWTLDKDKYRKVILSLAPGYNISWSDKDFTNVHQPGAHGWKGTARLLPRLDYAITNEFWVYGSFTWNHLTNFYASDSGVPDRDTFSFAASLSYKPKICKAGVEEKNCHPFALSLTYQYDGLNDDFYQHSVTLVATYTF